MRDQEWASMQETDFDSMLVHSVPELPPNDIVTEVTPWRKAMDQILVGMALATVMFDFWGLNYILPTIGLLLCLLGFRTLRNESVWLKLCWILSAARMACHLVSLILNAVIFPDAALFSQVTSVLISVGQPLLFLLLLAFWKGLSVIQQKAGLPSRVGSAAALVLWYAVLWLLFLLQVGIIPLVLIMIAVYALILRSLFRLSRALDESGYTIRAASVRVSDQTVVIAVLAVLAAGIACGYLFFHSYPMDWTPEEVSDSAEAGEIREQLLALNFPAAVLEDLSEEDLAACKGALRVVSAAEDFAADSLDSPREIQRITGVAPEEVKGFHITSVAVELPGEQEQWKIIHHFLWTVDPGFYGTEAIQLWPAYRFEKLWRAAGDLSGRLLYDRDGQRYTAPYYLLEENPYAAFSFFGDTQTSPYVFAAFSMPSRGENHRGYLSYTIQEVQDSWTIDTWIEYTHQRGWAQYPVTTALEFQMSGWGSSPVFRTASGALQFDPNAQNH